MLLKSDSGHLPCVVGIMALFYFNKIACVCVCVCNINQDLSFKVWVPIWEANLVLVPACTLASFFSYR